MPTNDQMAESYLAALELPAQLAPDGEFTRQGGSTLIRSGTHFSRFNGIFTAGRPDPDDVAALARSARDDGIPWGIQVRGEPDDEIVGIARRHGLSRRHAVPFLVATAEQVSFRGGIPAGATIGTLYGAESELFAQMVTDAYGVGPGILGEFLSGPLLDDASAEACVVHEDGLPVSTGLTIRRGDVAAVFNIATLPPYRRRGYGRVTTEWLLQKALAIGAGAAALHPTKLSLGLFRELGFRHAETWTYLTA